MSDELKITISATLTNSSLRETINPSQMSITQNTQRSHCPVVDVGTSEEDIATGDIGTLGWLFMQNLDTTNYVTWGPKSGGAMVAVGRLKATEVAAFRLSPGITLRMQANGGTVKIKFWILDD